VKIFFGKIFAAGTKTKQITKNNNIKKLTQLIGVLKSCSCGSTSFLALGYPLTAMLEGATAGIALELFLIFFYCYFSVLFFVLF